MRTGRPPIGDAEKIRRGTFRPEDSDAARAARGAAKVVAIFGADTIDVIPDPPAGLSERARQEYDRWTRRLHEVGRLTQVWVDKITLYAVRRYSIEVRLAAGKAPKADDVKACELFLKELTFINVDAPMVGQEAEKSRFGRVGALSRAVSRPE